MDISSIFEADMRLARRAVRLTAGVAAIALVFGLAACGADDPAGGEAGTCEVDTDCELGEVCSASGQCIEADCDHCTEDQICYIPPGGGEGTCSAPECSSDDDCPDGTCEDGLCTEEGACDDDDDCPDGQECHPITNTCQDDGSGGGGDECSTDDDCPGGSCDDGTCISDSSCELTDEDCDAPTPHVYGDDDSCECAECGDDTHCAGDLICDGGTCAEDDGGGNGGDGPDPNECIECDPDEPGICDGDTPYCIDECCVECIGAGDCDGNEICNDGFCSDASGCTDDSDCPTGYDCDGGECIPPDAGGECQEDGDCPDGQFCNPQTETCEELGGDMGCGLCNPDCTCDGDLTCDGFFCVGCETTLTIDGLDNNCPEDDQICADFLGVDACF